jgi:hypothetical protein
LLASAVPPPDSILIAPYELTEVESTSYGVTAQAGLDVDISITDRFSVVPQMRAFAAGNILSVPPGIVARLKW